jgi:hypothetical protein
MAERRMFAKTIIDSDAFLEMPVTSQLLYFHLSMRADDDGFVNKPKSLMRMVGCKDDDLTLLFVKKFLIPFESGVVVIKHWKIHNYIRKDTYTETKYKEEKATLELDENSAYRLTGDSPLQLRDESVTSPSTQVRLGQVSTGKDSVGKDIKEAEPPTRSKRFIPPTVEEVREYCFERGNSVDPQRFVDYYSSNGWMVGKSKMKDWKAAVRTWEQREKDKPHMNTTAQKRVGSFIELVEDDYD